MINYPAVDDGPGSRPVIDVRTFTAGPQTVIEVTAPDGAELPEQWRKQWAQAGRDARAEWFSVRLDYASVRLRTGSAGPLLTLAAQLADE